MPEENRCLLLSCAKAKRQDKCALPAIERYDGPYFRVLRRFFKQTLNAHQPVKVLILSAEYGLIDAAHPVMFYDRRMTSVRAEELRPQVLSKLKTYLNSFSFKELFILLGKDYSEATLNFEGIIPPEITVLRAKGAQGRKAKELKCWLYGMSDDTSSQFSNVKINRNIRGHAFIHGRRISMDPAKIVAVARQSLQENKEKAVKFRNWYVLVDGVRVGPKWLVSELTKLPVSSFTSGEARRVLYHLGVPVLAVKPQG